MMYCERCDIDVFGGSVCHECGGTLIPKIEDKAPKVVHISSEVIMGKKKTISVDAAQSLGGRLFRLAAEILLFCAIFYFLSLGVAHTINWLSREMAMNPETEPDAINIASNAFKYFYYIGLVVVALLTIKFRFQLGK